MKLQEKIIHPQTVVYNLIPDRTVENKKSYNFARDLHDIYSSWFKRIQQAREVDALYKTKERFWWIIRMTNKEIKFYFACSTSSDTYINQKIDRLWSKVTKKQTKLDDIQMPIMDTLVCEMKYRRHNIFSLSSDWREETIPIASILNIAQDLKDGDIAGIWICVEPVSRIGWSDIAEKAHEQFKQGKTPQRRNITGRFSLINLGRGIDAALHEVSDFADLVMEDDKKKKKKEDYDKRELMVDGHLDSMTRSKRHAPTFKIYIRCVSHSLNFDRKQIALRALSNAFNELSGDNELIRHEINRKIQPKYIKEINNLELSSLSIADFDTNIMSADEVGKLLQLPTASLQDQYANYLNIIEHRETDLPERLLKDGMKLGTITIRGQIKNIYFPVKDHDELCLPRIGIGGMGTGKTTGFGGNFGVEAVRNGFSIVAIDVAKDELGDEIGTGCKKLGLENKIIRLKFGKQLMRLDWCEALGSKYATNRFAAEVLNFFSLHGHEAGIETTRYIRLVAKTVSLGTGKLSDIIRLFTNDDFRKAQINQLKKSGKVELAEQWNSFEQLSSGMRGKVLEPILNRLDLLIGDDYLRDCLDCEDVLDFRKWLNGGFAICCHVPKDELGSEATDIIVSILIAKVWLATLARPYKEQIPAFLVMDEPHQFMSSAKHWKSMVVESRKWRLGLVWLFHSWEQIPKDLAEIIKSAGVHYHLYTSSKKTYKDLAEEIAPFTLEEALKTPRYSAINVLRSSGVTITPFMAKMTAPPSKS